MFQKRIVDPIMKTPGCFVARSFLTLSLVIFALPSLVTAEELSNSIQSVTYGGVTIQDGDSVTSTDFFSSGNEPENLWDFLIDWPNAVFGHEGYLMSFRGVFGNLEGTPNNETELLYAQTEDGAQITGDTIWIHKDSLRTEYGLASTTIRELTIKADIAQSGEVRARVGVGYASGLGGTPTIPVREEFCISDTTFGPHTFVLNSPIDIDEISSGDGFVVIQFHFFDGGGSCAGGVLENGSQPQFQGSDTNPVPYAYFYVFSNAFIRTNFDPFLLINGYNTASTPFKSQNFSVNTKSWLSGISRFSKSLTFPELGTTAPSGTYTIMVAEGEGRSATPEALVEWFASGGTTGIAPAKHSFLTFDYDAEAEPDPVIIIPGILGSWEKNGEWIIDPVRHTYDDLIETFELNGFVREQDLFTFPYEWRESNVFTAGLLRNKINEVQAICECEKVDIIAHSMGGLVARYYIQSGLYEDDIDQLIFLGTPHLGAPKAYLAWEGGKWGFSFEDLLLETRLGAEARLNGYSSLFSYIQGQPIISVNQLLSTVDYIKDADTFSLREYPANYPRNTFLEDLNSNVSALLESDVDITNIVGNLGNSSTITTLRVVDSPNPPKWEHGYPENFNDGNTDRGLETGVGDATVPLGSANFIDSNVIEFNSEHSRIIKDAQAFVFEALTGSEPDEVSLTSPFPNVLLLISIFSPVDVYVIDPQGNRIGKNLMTGEEYNEIDGAFYSGYLTHNEYITIPNPLNGEYRVVAEGTDSGGEYTVLASYIDDNVLVQAEEISYIIPGDTEEVTVTVDTSTSEELTVDDTTVVTLQILLEHINAAYQLGWISDQDYKENLENIVNAIINSEEPNREPLLKVFIKRLENGLKDGYINISGYQFLREDIYSLLE